MVAVNTKKMAPGSILLSKELRKQLFDDLHYLKIAELKKLCTFYELPVTNKKEQLISFILAHVLGENVIVPGPYPEVSRSQRGFRPPLAPESLMLMGAYKNDLKTRAFFKKFLGSHFHFTAYGIDWLDACWRQGNPPTYAEFATFWQSEHEKRKLVPAPLKKEWALLNFLQRYKAANPQATKSETTKAWHSERERAVKRVAELLELDFFKE